MLPYVKIEFANGALGATEPMEDGVAGLVATGVAVASKFVLNTPYPVNRLGDLGITSDASDANAVIYKAVKEFYDEAPEGTKLWILAASDTEGQDDLVDKTKAGNAKKLIYIQTPYFLPTSGLLIALQTAALSKVDVRIMIPRNPDSTTLRLASASYLSECMRSGIKIYYYEPGMLHSKVVIVDDEFATTGSTNFDFRSFEYNFECNAFIYSREFNKKMREIFIRDMKKCTRVNPTNWRHRPFFEKLKESLVRLLSPVL